VSGDRGNELADIRRKLVEGTEVLRTGGGATLKAGECNALLSRLDTLEAERDQRIREAHYARSALRADEAQK
jgi:hypothetical protein